MKKKKSWAAGHIKPLSLDANIFATGSAKSSTKRET